MSTRDALSPMLDVPVRALILKHLIIELLSDDITLSSARIFAQRLFAIRRQRRTSSDPCSLPLSVCLRVFNDAVDELFSNVLYPLYCRIQPEWFTDKAPPWSGIVALHPTDFQRWMVSTLHARTTGVLASVDREDISRRVLPSAAIVLREDATTFKVASRQCLEAICLWHGAVALNAVHYGVHPLSERGSPLTQDDSTVLPCWVRELYGRLLEFLLLWRDNDHELSFEVIDQRLRCFRAMADSAWPIAPRRAVMGWVSETTLGNTVGLRQHLVGFVHDLINPDGFGVRPRLLNLRRVLGMEIPPEWSAEDGPRTPTCRSDDRYIRRRGGVPSHLFAAAPRWMWYIFLLACLGMRREELDIVLPRFLRSQRSSLTGEILRAGYGSQESLREEAVARACVESARDDANEVA
jgi:hypothetical protein